jgi:xylitol oxidase
MFLTRLFGRLYGARPHWGKVCPLLPEEVAPLYPDLARFRAAAAELDPHGQFRNEWTDGMLFGTPPGNIGGG